MNRRRLLTILGAIALTLIGTLILVAYVSSAEDRARQGEDLTTILVAGERVAAGTPAADLADLVQRVEVPAYVRPGDAVKDLQSLGNQVTTADLLPQEPLREAQFGRPGAAAGELPADLPEGLQIVSVALEAQRALGGRIQAGQEVGIVMSVDQADLPEGADPGEEEEADTATGMVLNRVPVTAVTGGVDDETGESAGTLMVSFAVDESDAERLVFGIEHGRIWLTQQSEDTPRITPDFRTRGNIFDNVDSGGG